MLGFVEINLRECLRAHGAVPYARRQRSGYFVLEIAAPQGVFILQRQRGGVREFKSLEALIKLLASKGVVEFAVLLDDAKVNTGGPVVPWNQRPRAEEISRATWRHDFDLPF